jgi:hypothetical protein
VVISIPLPDEEMNIESHSLSINITEEIDIHAVLNLQNQEKVLKKKNKRIQTSTGSFIPLGVGLMRES